MTITFEVLGHCQTAGSKRGFAIARKGQPMTLNGKFNGRVLITDMNPKGREWKNRIADIASQAMAKLDLPFQEPLLTGPVEVWFEFRMPRPQSHYRTGQFCGHLKDSAPTWHIGRPDALKLARCAEDALTGVVWRDDSQIVKEHLEKVYGDVPGMNVTICTLAVAVERVMEKQAGLALA